jgi:hypothetical protein
MGCSRWVSGSALPQYQAILRLTKNGPQEGARKILQQGVKVEAVAYSAAVQMI